MFLACLLCWPLVDCLACGSVLNKHLLKRHTLVEILNWSLRMLLTPLLSMGYIYLTELCCHDADYFLALCWIEWDYVSSGELLRLNARTWVFVFRLLKQNNLKTGAEWYPGCLWTLWIKKVFFFFRKSHILKVKEGDSQKRTFLSDLNSMTSCPLWKSMTENVYHGA